jgi:hypothetical protein
MLNCREPAMPNEEGILEVVGLIFSGLAVSEDFLAGDVHGPGFAPLSLPATPAFTA